MNIALVSHRPPGAEEAWSTPMGLSAALSSEGARVVSYPFTNPAAVTFPSLSQLLADQIDAVLIFYAGPSPSLDAELIKLRLMIDAQQSGLKIICELGDEPQTRRHNATRVQISDLCLSPDHPSVLQWRSLGAPCVWYTHWADTSVFSESQDVLRDQFVVTTMGRRRYATRLSLLLGRHFENRHCRGTENGVFYSKGLIAFQYARWNEITRRVFEAAACGCCILTNRLPAATCMEEIFPADVAIVYYEGFFSLLIALWKLMMKPALRQAIASEGQRRVLLGHTQLIRAQQLLSYLNTMDKATP
jgi:hypothetical protein